MNKGKCLLLTPSLEKDKVVTFERVARAGLLETLDCRSILFGHFGHNIRDLNDLVKLVKEKKPSGILFDSFTDEKKKEIITCLEKRVPGNKIEYGAHSKGQIITIDKSVVIPKKKKEEILEVA